MNFSTVKNWTIPEGNVIQVVDSNGIILWKKKEETSTWGNLIIKWDDGAAERLENIFLQSITFADAASPTLIDNYQKIGKGVYFNSDPNGYGTISFENASEIEFINAVDAMVNWGTNYVYVGYASGDPTSDFEFICAVETNQLTQALNFILNGNGTQEVQCYFEQGQTAYIKQLDGGFTASSFKTTITVYDSYSFGWKFVPSASWISLSSTVGSGRKSVTMTVSTNTSTSSRTGEIYLQSLITGETLSTLTITQPGVASPAPSISVSPSQISFDKNGGTNYLTINCTGSWYLTVIPSEINTDQTIMPTVSKTSGTGTTRIMVSRPALLNADFASGNIYWWTISVTSNGEQATCDVIQDGALEM